MTASEIIPGVLRPNEGALARAVRERDQRSNDRDRGSRKPVLVVCGACENSAFLSTPTSDQITVERVDNRGAILSDNPA